MLAPTWEEASSPLNQNSRDIFMYRNIIVICRISRCDNFLSRQAHGLDASGSRQIIHFVHARRSALIEPSCGEHRIDSLLEV